ncbi:MAG: RHS repeat domain-containing protein [Acidobacteriota bacterium]
MLRDRLGSVMARAGDSTALERHDYFPCGEERTPSIGDRNKFGTYHRDQTGLDYADQRYYNSAIGRFLTSDPYEASAKVEAPTTWARGGYVEGDPINANDPTGLETSTVPYGPPGFFRTCVTLGSSESTSCYVWSLTMEPARQSGRTAITNYDWNELIREMNTQIATGAKECRDNAKSFLDKQRGDGRFGIMSDFKKEEDVLSRNLFSMISLGVLEEVSLATLSGGELIGAASVFDAARRLFVTNSRYVLGLAVIIAGYQINAYLTATDALAKQFNRDFSEYSLKDSMRWYESVFTTYDKMMQQCEDQAAKQLVWRMQYLNMNYYLIP